MNALEEKYDAARERAVQTLREHGMYSKEFRTAFEQSFDLYEELKKQHPDSELLKIDLEKMFNRRENIQGDKDE